MRKYKRFNATPEALEQYELGLKDDGTFVWLVTRSGEDGETTHHAHGSWNQIGEAIVFEIAHASDDAPVPTTAVVTGERLELAGFGTFA